MSLTAIVPTRVVMSVKGAEISSYIPLSLPDQIVQCLEEDDKDYLDYLLEPQLAITFPGELRRDFDFSADRQNVIFTYLSGSKISGYLRALCEQHGIEFTEH